MKAAHLSAEEVCNRTLAMQDGLQHYHGYLWRAESYKSTEGLPMTMRRALALNAVLEKCGLPLIPGELLIGSGLGVWMKDGDAEEIKKAQGYLAPFSPRHFGANADHSAPDYAKLLKVGIGGLKAEAEQSLKKHTEAEKREFLESVIVALDGAEKHILRWADAVEESVSANPDLADLLKTQADMLRHLSAKPARSLWEAIQLVLIVHCMMQIDFRYAMAFGRVDQFLYPYYLADMEADRITKEDAQTLLDHFLAKLAHRGDIQNICVGGVDPRGSDATNDLSYMIVNSVMRIGKPGGNLTARINKNTPHSFLAKCAESIRTGIGFPAMFNDEVQVPALVKQGWPVADARNYCFVGCIEIFAQGKQAPWSDSRFNTLQCVDFALRSGVDGLTGKQAGPETSEPQTWDEFYQAFLVQMRAGIKEHVKLVNSMKQPFEDSPMDFTSPLMSALYEDCIGRGLDQCMGGTVYPSNHGVASMGIGSVADSMMALKKFVYEEKRFTLDEIRAMLDANFEGYEKERMLLLKGAPKYGNDNEEVDAIAVEVVRDVGEECMKYNTLTGGVFWSLMAANVSNIYAGREVGATPDGRLSQQPLSDAGSPTFGRDENGPTAVIRSISKVDYTFARGGNVVNMKFSPSALEGEAGLNNLANLIRTCFDLGGIQLQFNTTDRDLLKKAMDNPVEYSNLVVRVSGFSAYYTALAREVQEDILSRTEHTGA